MIITKGNTEEGHYIEEATSPSGDDKRASGSNRTGQDARAELLPPPSYAAYPQQQSTSTSYYATAPARYDPPSALPSSSNTSFSRPRAQGLPYQAFKPTYLAASGKSLDKGFPMIPPPSEEPPHPFVTHDVNEGDWLQFLSDVRKAGSLTEKDIRRSHLPIISLVPFVNGLSAYGVQQFMKSRKTEAVARVIDNWNHHFFEPRKIQIVLMKGSVKVSGLTDHPIGGLYTPVASNVPPVVQVNQASQSTILGGKTDKGKAKENGDNIYRLFVLPV